MFTGLDKYSFNSYLIEKIMSGEFVRGHFKFSGSSNMETTTLEELFISGR